MKPKPKTYIPFCPYCRGPVTPLEPNPPHEWWVCPRHGEIETEDVEFEDEKEIEQ
jgi:hypothetical protein